MNTEYPGATVAIATTVGQSEINEILQHPESWIKRHKLQIEDAGRRLKLRLHTKTPLPGLSPVAEIFRTHWRKTRDAGERR